MPSVLCPLMKGGSDSMSKPQRFGGRIGWVAMSAIGVALLLLVLLLVNKGFISSFIDFVVHLDRNLKLIIQDFGPWTYLILFLIVFCETGLVVAPFLPGDSLLLVAGILASDGSLEVAYFVKRMLAYSKKNT
jgi:hypothetical protein